MKKIDFHIHTVPTVSDQYFEYNQTILEKYIAELSLDAIAITNHNTFDKEQYDKICEAVNIPVFPGIEIDIEKGHLLVITTKLDLIDFSARCKSVQQKIQSETDYLTETQFLELFPNIDKYLIIPHMGKAPALSMEKVPKLIPYITCGEVNSIKKFESLKKAEGSITPVYFSDIRIRKDINTFPSRYTFVDVDTLSLANIKMALSDKGKVSLSQENGNSIIQILSNGLKISTGLNVLLGERSSGKTHTLNAIFESLENVKYIKQFTLVTKDNELDQRRFEELLQARCSSVSEEYFSEFKGVVDNVKNIHLDMDEKQIEEYLRLLLKSAEDADKEDVFAKTALFSESLFGQNDLDMLIRLIDSTTMLIENEEYRSIIDTYVDKQSLIRLSIALMEKYIIEKEQSLKKTFLNDIIETIKAELRVRTASTPVPEIDFYNILMNKKKIKKFIEIAQSIKAQHIIYSKDLHSFKVVATVCPFTGAQQLKNLSGRVLAFSDAFEKYQDPYEYLCELRKKAELPGSDYFKYFAAIKYEVLNKHGFKASGGERAEYNLLDQLSNATQYDMLLIDEPESSFDNLFLKKDVNSLLKDISKIIPVIVATHNNTIGASVKPDYIIYTKKEVDQNGKVNYKIYSGLPTSDMLVELKGETLRKHDILLDCLEAGESAYVERRITYEMFDN